jgi:hypothetical protein
MVELEAALNTNCISLRLLLSLLSREFATLESPNGQECGPSQACHPGYRDEALQIHSQISISVVTTGGLLSRRLVLPHKLDVSVLWNLSRPFVSAFDSGWPIHRGTKSGLLCEHCTSAKSVRHFENLAALWAEQPFYLLRI